MHDENEFRQRVQQIESLVQQISSFAAPETRAIAEELVRSLMDLHGAGIERMLELVWESGDRGPAIIDSLARDGLVGSLLLLYGLHPLDMEARVGQALDRLQPEMRRLGGQLEPLGTINGVVRLRFTGSLAGCGSSAQTVSQTIQQAIFEAAPEADSVLVDGLEPAVTLVQLEGLCKQGKSHGFQIMPGAAENTSSISKGELNNV